MTSSPPPEVARRFEGRRVLVTGASRGIGAGLAERFAAEGAHMAISARTLDHHEALAGSLRETADRLGAHGGQVAVVVADLARETDRVRLVPDATSALGGPIDILVNNAAAAIYQPLADYPLTRRRLVFEVNTHAPIDLAQAVLPAMLDRGEGWIVSVSSGAARLPTRPGALGSTLGVYGASKAALDRLSVALAEEVRGSGVRVNTIQPRAGVRSEGADALVGGRLRADQFEPLETMVEATTALCAGPPELTGGVHVSLDLLDRLGLTVRGLDGRPPAS